MNTYCNFSAAAAALAAGIVCMPIAASADSLALNYLAPHYTARSVELGIPFGGALAIDPHNENRLYVSAGNYAEHSILEVDTDTGTTRTVTPIVGNIGGLAVMENGDLAITENDDFSSDTILLARDGNLDGDWLDQGEISELISPILTTNFTGAQLAVAPNHAVGIPAGALVVQTADGGSDSEILVVENPTAAPAYRPANAAYYSGFTYNGGVAFTSAGHLLCGVSEFPSGKVTALVNSNSDSDIDSGEARDIVTSASLPNSISDLTVSADSVLFTTENSGTVRWFNLPGGLDEIVTGDAFAETNGTYLSSVRLDGQLEFRPGNAGNGATLYIGGYVSFPAATNLLAISLSTTASAVGWDLYE